VDLLHKVGAKVWMQAASVEQAIEVKTKKRTRERHEFEIPNADSNSTRRAQGSQAQTS